MRLLIAMLVAVTALFGVLLVVALIVDGSRSNQVAEGIRVAGVDVGGLDVDDARERVSRRLGGSVRRPVVVTYRSKRYVLRPEVSGARLDARATAEAARKRGREGSALGRFFGGGDVHASVGPRIAYSRPAVQEFVARIAKRVDRPARDADVDVRDGKVRLRRARNGLTVRRAALLGALERRLEAPRADRPIPLPVKVTDRPDRTLTELAERYPTMLAIDRDAKTLRLYRRLKLVDRYKIAVGKAGYESAAGRYKIQEKTVDPAWHAPNKAWAGELAGKTIPPGDPRNPLEARWMGFYDGQGIHGTKDIGSLGTAASHGCIRMSVPEVKEVFRKVRVGTPLFLQ